MRKLLVSIAAIGTALVAASPAAAQYAPFPPRAPYGYAYGQPVGDHFARQIQQLRIRADQLARAGRLSPGEARDLRHDIGAAESALYNGGRHGIAPWEAQRIQQRIDRVRFELRRYADYDGRRGGWHRW